MCARKDSVHHAGKVNVHGAPLAPLNKQEVPLRETTPLYDDKSAKLISITEKVPN
jgi:hypothetical protein